MAEGKADEGAVEANLALVEAFLIRRSFAGFEPTGLHAVFKGLWADTKGDPQKLIDVIDANPTVAFPSDEEFSEHIHVRPLYGRKLAKYVLREYERALPGGDETPDVAFTIDHVMPQELTDTWRKVISDEDHEALKHTWANLVPLTAPANSQKGQMDWSGIREYYKTETIFKTTKRLVYEFDEWNKETIGLRSDQLRAWALGRWPKEA